MSSAIRYTRNLFLRSICVVYLFAFISFYVQIPGLYGDNGILPARSLLENSKHQTLSAKVHYQPTLLWLAPYLGLDTHYALDVLALLGSFLAFTGFVSQKFCSIPLFAGLWSLYFSLYQIGQVFVQYQFDGLLLEVGFLSIFVAPLIARTKYGSKGVPTDSVSLWLIRWLLFRFLLTSGLTKLLSGCPKWWDLSALNYHFETMPLPSPLSWYSHHLPTWVLQLSTVYANVCEFILPFFFFVPIRSVRIVAFVFQIFLQICIVLTGNFNFLNLLIVALSISLLDDKFFFGKRPSPIVSKIVTFLLYGAVLYGLVVFYSLKINNGIIESKIAFTKVEFDYVVKQGLNIVMILAAVSFTGTVIRALYSSLTTNSGFLGKLYSILILVFYTAVALIIFAASTVPLASLHTATNSTVDPSLRTIYNRLHKLQAVNQYGLFKQMVTTRKEIVLEGAYNIDGPWIEYNFLYKPGNVNHSLPFVAPYSPRLDWQMYFAAQSSYLNEPWLLSLTHRLLTGRPEVLGLLDRNHHPFTQKPPKFIRAVLYHYTYTPWSQRSQSAWWQRSRIGEYFPAFSKDSPTLLDYLKPRNLLPPTKKTTVNPIWKQILDGVRYVTGHLEATLLLWSVFTAGCAIITTTTKSK